MLEARALTVAYGAHRALDDVSVRVAPGEICVILGANGAGKSTLLKAIAGVVPVADGGEIVMGGVTITGKKPDRIVEAGIALVPEGRGIFGGLSVTENLQLGAFASRARSAEAANMERVLRLFPKLAERAGQDVRTLSGGEQQMVAIGRALMSNPDILMLDEPSLGLSPLLSSDLFAALAEIGKAGVGILLVEQNARLSLKIADRGYLLENGRIGSAAAAVDLARDRAVIEAYLGGSTSLVAGRMGMRSDNGHKMTGGGRDVARLAGQLSVRASFVRAADQHARRLAQTVLSAFAGRYDPATLAVPTPVAPVRAGRPVTDDAVNLSQQAETMARAAETRYRAYLRINRKSRPLPAAFASMDYVPAAPVTPDQGNDGAADTRSERKMLTDMASEFARLAQAKTTSAARSRLPGMAGTGNDREKSEKKAPGYGNGANRPREMPL
ncbi:MAG: ABC transporter ATP-binding protein [Alphaproteobacteria bacterium]